MVQVAQGEMPVHSESGTDPRGAFMQKALGWPRTRNECSCTLQHATCHRHRPQASAARNRSSCPFPCAGIPAARGLTRTPTMQTLTSMYQEAFAVHQEEAGDEEYPDREPSPPASPFTRNIFQRRWSIGLPRARSDSVSSFASM
jgi:hypothetical protein